MNKLLAKWVVGWDEIEPIIVANIATRKPFILIGKHGIAKSTVAKQFAKIYGKENGFRFYDATKDDMISIAGIPNPEELAKGNMKYAKHERSIWDAKIVVVDELTRACKDNQNMWLEILQEKSCYGLPLKYEAFIATMNPESYAATFKLDEALFDRFYAIVPVPDLQKADAELYKELIELNFTNSREDDPTELRIAIEEIQKSTKEFENNRELREGVAEYVGNMVEIIHSQISKEAYISTRKLLQITQEILAVSAYYKWAGEEDFLEKGASLAILYTLIIPMKLKQEPIYQLHKKLVPFLKKYSLSKADMIRLELAKTEDNEEKFKYVRNRIEDIERELPFDEVDKLLNELYESLVKEYEEKDIAKYSTIKLKHWWKLINKTNHEEVKRKSSALLILVVDYLLGCELKKYDDKCVDITDYTSLSREETLMKNARQAQDSTLDSLVDKLGKEMIEEVK